MTPDVLKDPVTTAQWEQLFEKIAHGELTLEAFMQDQIAILPSLLDPVLSRPVVLHPNAFPCPKCGKAMHKCPDKKFGGFFWACSDPDCRSFLPDDNGKPDTPREFPCPACGKPLYRKKKRGNRIGPATTVRTMLMAKTFFFRTTPASPVSLNLGLRES